MANLCVWLDCACSSHRDALCLRYEDEDPMILTLSTLWGRGGSLWRRVRDAIRYVWSGPPCRFGASAEHVFTPETARECRDLLDRYLVEMGRSNG